MKKQEIEIKLPLKARIEVFMIILKIKGGWKYKLKSFKEIFFPPKSKAIFG